jgi:murein DD-endopeptidase MepM/ murein hydrolase activator NlpD
MQRRGAHFKTLFLLLLTGCIPISADHPGPTRRAADAPRLEPVIDLLYDEKPVWEARPVVADALTVTGSTYIVQPGDTLRSIGARTGVGSETLARTNSLSSPYVIKVGQRLTVAAGRYHLVRQGESGIAIARAYGVGWSQIVATNALEEPYVLRVGQRLAIPGSTNAVPRSMEARAAAFRIDINDILTGGEPAQTEAQIAATPVVRPTAALSPAATIAEPSSFSGGFIWPVSGPVIGRFGPVSEGRVNDGIDIAVPVGTPFRAASDGVIAYVGSGVAGYGGLILIRHGGGWITAYGHAAEASVTRGQAVKRGQIIGTSGETGTATRPQLHFEIRQKRTPVDPLGKLPKAGRVE